MNNEIEKQVELWIATIPQEVLKEVGELKVTEAGFGAGPGCCVGKVEQFDEPVSLSAGLGWIAGYASVLKAAHIRLTDGSVLWLWPSKFMRWAPGEQAVPRPGLVVGG